MGEWSKSIGEKGERITKFIFEEIIGVNSLIENTNVDCQKGKEHKRKVAKNERTTHGVDGLYFHESPLEDELLDIIIISSKYTIKYPKSPKSDFKAHISDLAQAIECFRISKKNNEISQSFNTVTKTSYTGVLVWLSNTDSVDFEMIPKVSNSIIDTNLEFEKIILLDNARVNFLYESIYKAKKQYDSLDYVYHNSSMNQSSFNSNTYGRKFPIEYLYSDIIILRVKDKDGVKFLIFVNDNFNPDNLRLVLSFAKTFDHLNTINTTQINYLDYDKLIHESQLKSVLTHYPNYKLDENLELNMFPLDYRR
ncbi:MAG: hypothetical protein ACI81T_004269 [Bacteroidia bacterium]|jgi:hypothetical protein